MRFFSKFKPFMICMVSTVFLLSACGKPTVSTPEKHEIPVPEGYETSQDDLGADAFQSLLDNPQSKYFTISDYYNMKSEGSLHILPKFETYQQTTEHTCGASCALMVMNHFGETAYDEMQLADLLHADPSRGVDPADMDALFTNLGWKVDSHIGTDTYFASPEEFSAYLIKQIDAGTPVLVDWVDWAGHWQVIIGIDTCSELSVYDDVLILADPYDVTDAYQDGYYIYPLGRFFGMWYEGPCAQKTQPLKQPFIAANPTACGASQKTTAAQILPEETAARILPEDSLMVPYSQNLEGAHGGYIFVPIDGQSYRYNVANVLPEDTKSKDKIFEFVETDDWGNELNWTIYTLSEDPSCQTLMGETGRLGILELAYAPALGSTQADIQDARNAGFVMMKDDEPEKDDGKWETFAAKCENGEAAEIRLGFIYTKEGLNMSEDLAAATADNYPALFLSELRFDGTQYTISPLGRLGEEYVVHERKGIDSPVQTFAYMLHLDDPDAERYVLVNDPTLTWERIWQGMLSSTLGDQVEYRMVYHRTKTNK